MARDGAGSSHEAGRLGARPGAAPPRTRLDAGQHALALADRRDGALLVPVGVPAGRAIPLVVALHGAGGVTAQMLDLLRAEAEARQVALLAPESRGSTWDVITGGFGPDVAFIDHVLGMVGERVAIDPSRIAVAGFSDGASYALSLGVANGDLFSDILAFSPGFMAAPGQQGRPRIFISHGRADEVLPIERCSRRLAPSLKQAGYDVEYNEFEGGHLVPGPMIALASARFLA